MLKSLQMAHFSSIKIDAPALFRGGILLLGCFFMMSCASEEPMKPPQAFSILEPEEEKISTPNPNKSLVYQKLSELLLSLGYQGVGLELEDDGTLEFLYQVFSSPKARNRKIQFVYTGLQLSYDKEQASLTFGEDNHLGRALKFIEKNIPIQK